VLLVDSEKLTEVMGAMARNKFDDMNKSAAALVQSNTIGKLLFQVAWESRAADSMQKPIQNLSMEIVAEMKLK
jgi:hypothetical protein